MQRIAVQSSALRAIAYDPAEQKLEVVFNPNKAGICPVWHYKPVAQSLVDEMLAEGASAGTIFHRTIRSSRLLEAYKVGEEPLETVVPA